MRCKIVVAVLLVVALSLPLAHQARADAPMWDILISGGWVNAQLNDKDRLAANDQTIDGYTAGAGVQLRVYPVFGIELGLRYTQKGGEGKIDSTFAVPNFANVTQEIGSAVVELNYIEIPLLFSYILSTGNNSYVRAYIGPTMGILVSSSVTGTVDGAPFSGDLDGVVSNTEWCGTVGASFDYSFGGWQLLVDYRYVSGISGIETDDQGGSLNTQAHEFALGVGIPVGRSE